MGRFHITKYFLARVFAVITLIVCVVGFLLFETYPQLSYYLRLIFAIMFAPAMIMLNKTKPKT